MRLALIRHGPTDWNAQGRLQGRADIPLNDAGWAKVATWVLPEDFADCSICTSPLKRTRATAFALARGRDVLDEPLLIEMSFGMWEGERLADLRAHDPQGMATNEDLGLDFQPPQGESPRQVQHRISPLLERWAREAQDRVAVTHKGVIRALFAQAMGWDMRGKPPVKLLWEHAHVFRLSIGAAGPILELDSVNIPLRGAAS